MVWGLVVAFGGASLRADMYTVRREGAGIVPEYSTEVSMDSEDVVVQEYEDGFNVTATFVMRNHSDQPVSSLVAFPIVGSTFKYLVDLSRDFHVEMKSGTDDREPFVPAKARLHQGPAPTPGFDVVAQEPPRRVADYPEAVVWDVTWAPAEAKTIRVRFDMGEPKLVRGSNELVVGWQLMYVVTTGALWKGPIGRAHISIRLSQGHFFRKPSAWSTRTWSYPAQARWEDENTLSWHFENWTPSEEIWLRSVHWSAEHALDHGYFHFQLPTYEGDRRVYTADDIDALARRDLTLAEEHFPELLKFFDVIPLKVAIADWLLHEIYARRGDPFYIGKETSTLEVARGFEGDSEGNIYSAWQSRFDRYGGLRGWYRPRRGPEGAVRTASLSETEQQNVRFLRGYLEALRPQLPPEFQQEPVHDPGID